MESHALSNQESQSGEGFNLTAESVGLGPDAQFVQEKELGINGTIVVKIGGSTLGSHDTTLEDVVELQRQGYRLVVVHGGGKLINHWMERQGVRPRFVKGLRVTDRPSLDIVVAVLTGVVNKSIVASILKIDGKAIGLAGVDGGMLRAKIITPELGLVGDVVEVDIAPICAVLDSGAIPVIAPVSVHADGDSPEEEPILNVNADSAAGEIAAFLRAERLVFMTDVEGVLDSSRRLIPRLTDRQARGLMRSNIIDGGMVPKIGACLKALEHIETAQIIDGRKPHALKQIMSGCGLGTRIG